MEIKPYLDYLDKEMTIMGILSAVGVAAPAGILGSVTTKEGSIGALFWGASSLFIVCGSVLCVIAALLFYTERSKLAWYYGQICLVQAMHAEGKEREAKLREWLVHADSWATWWPYVSGFTFLIAAFAEYLLGMLFALLPLHWPGVRDHLHACKAWVLVVCPVLAIAGALLQYYVRTRYSLEEDAWAAFRADLWKRKAGGSR